MNQSKGIGFRADGQKIIPSAINNIYTEYGAIPDVGSRVTTNSPAGLKLLNILLGRDVKSKGALNSRAIKFLSVKEGKNHENGLIYGPDGNSVEGLYDRWETPTPSYLIRHTKNISTSPSVQKPSI